MITKRHFLSLVIVLSLVAVALFVSNVAAQDSGPIIRWDTASGTVNEAGMFALAAGGTAYARAYDGSLLVISGSGTFSVSDPGAVTGGGEWTTYDRDENPTGNGVFTVTEIIDWQEAEGVLPAEFVLDEIGLNDDARGGLAILRVAYSNEDGSPSGTGILAIGCRLGGTPFTVIEGFAGTKGSAMFLESAQTFPGLDINFTVFHVVP